MDLKSARELEAYSDKFLTEGYYGSNWSFDTMVLKIGPDDYRPFYADGECGDPRPGKVGGFFLDSKEAIEAMNFYFGGDHNDWSRQMTLDGLDQDDDTGYDIWDEAREALSEQYAPYKYLSVKKHPELRKFYEDHQW